MTESKKESLYEKIDWQDLADYLENKAAVLGRAEARPIQRRRGTAAEHAEFIGLDGEITIDTTNKTIRVHDGETPGGTVLAKISDIADGGGGAMPDGIDIDALAQMVEQFASMDYVVESGGNSTAWYRKYKSGWVEQGGKKLGNLKEYTLPLAMKDTNYTILTTTANNYSITIQGYPLTSSTFVLRAQNTAGGEYNAWTGSWTVSGWAA